MKLFAQNVGICHLFLWILSFKLCVLSTEKLLHMLPFVNMYRFPNEALLLPLFKENDLAHYKLIILLTIFFWLFVFTEDQTHNITLVRKPFVPVY